jgi:hypothetical protein
MPGVTLHPADACELAEMLSFIDGWLARDPRLAESLADFVGHPGLRHPSAARGSGPVVFLLGGRDSEQWWCPGPQ